MHHKRHHRIRKADLMTCEIVFSVFFKLQIREDGQRWNDKQTMRLVRRLHSFAIGHVYIFPIEALAKVNLKRDGASREKLVMWNRWGRKNRGISDGCQSSGFKCVLITTQTMLCNSGAYKGRIFHGCVCAHVSNSMHAPADRGVRTGIRTCCSYLCLSASSCSEKSLACRSLTDLERVRSSSTFSICRQNENNIDGWFLTLCRVRNHLWSFPDGVLLHTDCVLAAGSLRRFKSGWFRASTQ